MILIFTTIPATKWRRNIPKFFIKHLIAIFFENDPYYPLPLIGLELDEKLWNISSA